MRDEMQEHQNLVLTTVVVHISIELMNAIRHTG